MEDQLEIIGKISLIVSRTQSKPQGHPKLSENSMRQDTFNKEFICLKIANGGRTAATA